MSRASTVSVLFFAVGMFLSAETASALEWRISLMPTPKFAGATGKAKYKNRGGEREFQVEVEDLQRFAGANFSVHVNGVFVGTMKINIFGDGRLSRNTDLGQPVPVITAGSAVAVRKPNGVKVLSGRFQETGQAPTQSTRLLDALALKMLSDSLVDTRLPGANE